MANAIRELLRRGYWDKADGEGNDLPGGDGADAQSDDGDQVQDLDAEAGDSEAEADAGSDRSMAEEIALTLGLKDQEQDDDEGELIKPEEKATSSLPENQRPDAKKQDGEKEEEDPYREPEWDKNTRESTKERFHELVEMNKEKDQQLEALANDARGFVQMVRDTGTNQEQFLEVLDTATLIFHPDKADPQEALRRLQSMSQMIAEAHGLEAPGYDPLSAHPDLQEKVNDYSLDRETAIELARARIQKKNQEQARTTQQQQEQQQRQSMDVKQAAIKAMTDFLKEAESNDVDFPAKAEIMSKAASFAAQNLHPSKWMEYMKNEYEIAGEYVTKNQSGGNSNSQPLRSSGNNRSTKVPSNMADAIKAGLGL